MRWAFPFIGLLSLLRATQTALKVSLSAVDEAFMEDCAFVRVSQGSNMAVDFTIGNAYLAACNILGYENASEACYALDKPPDSSLPLVDWALTTVPPTDIQSARYTDLQLLPAVNRLVAPVFNLPDESPSGIPRQGNLRLSNDLLAQILLGQVRAWNDSSIMKLNPHLQSYLTDLGAEGIILIVPGDVSTTTYVVTNVLSRVNEAFNTGIGVSASPSWCETTSELHHILVNTSNTEVFALTFEGRHTRELNTTVDAASLAAALIGVIGNASDIYVKREPTNSSSSWNIFSIGYIGSYAHTNMARLITNASSSAVQIQTHQEGGFAASAFASPNITESQRVCVEFSERESTTLVLAWASRLSEVRSPTNSSVSVALDDIGWLVSAVQEQHTGSFLCFVCVYHISGVDVGAFSISSNGTAFSDTLTDGGLSPCKQQYTIGGNTMKIEAFTCLKSSQRFDPWTYTTASSTNALVGRMLSEPYTFGYLSMLDAISADIDMADMFDADGRLVTAEAALNHTVLEQSELGHEVVLTPEAWPLQSQAYFVFRNNHHSGTCAARTAAMKWLTWFYSSASADSILNRLSASIVSADVRSWILEHLYHNVYCNNGALALPGEVPREVLHFGSLSNENLIKTFHDAYLEKDTSSKWSFVDVGDDSTDALARFSLAVNSDRSKLATTSIFVYNEDALRSALLNISSIYGGPVGYVGVTFSFNILCDGELITDLTLSAEVIDLIYAGDIIKWSDERIVSLNPSVCVSDTPIVPIYRADRCDVNKILTKYLARSSTVSRWSASTNFTLASPYVDMDWKAATSDARLAATISATPGSIGYMLQSTLLPQAKLQLAGGSVLSFSIDALQRCELASYGKNAITVTAIAGDDDTYARSYSTYIVIMDPQDSTSPSCWPISAALNMNVPSEFQVNCSSAQESIIKFVGWIFSSDSVLSSVKSLGISPPSSTVRSDVYGALENVYCNGSPILRTTYACTIDDFTYTVSSCNVATGKRCVTFQKSYTTTCSGGLHKISSVTLNCDYIPGVSVNGQVIGVIAIFGMLLCGCAVTALLWFRKQKVIRQGQIRFLLLFAVGALLLQVTPIMFIGPPSTSVCKARPIVFAYFSTCMFGALFMKIHRVNVLFNNAKLRRIHISNARVLLNIVKLLLIDTVLIAVWMALDAPRVTVTYSHLARYPSVLVHNSSCGIIGSPFISVLATYKGLLILFGVYVAVRCWKLPSEFSEAKYVSIAIYNTMVIAGVSATLIYLVPLSFAHQIIVFTCGIFLSCTAAVVLVLGPKLLCIYRNRTAAPESAMFGFMCKASNLMSITKSKKANTSIKRSARHTRVSHPILEEHDKIPSKSTGLRSVSTVAPIPQPLDIVGKSMPYMREKQSEVEDDESSYSESSSSESELESFSSNSSKTGSIRIASANVEV